MPRHKAAKANHENESLHRLGSVTEEIDIGLRSTLRGLAVPVLKEIWEREVTELCGPRWHPAAHGRVGRGGSCVVQVTLGGQVVSIRRPRVRGVTGREIELQSYRMVLEEDLLQGRTLEAIAIGAATGYTARLTGHHEHHGQFAESLANHLAEVIWKPIRELGPTLVVGELRLRRFSALACVGITASGKRSLVALHAGGSASPSNVRDFLSQLRSRIAVSVKPRLLLTGESQNLHAAVRESFEDDVAVQRCPMEKTREVLALLPPALQPITMRELDTAFYLEDTNRAVNELERIASNLEAESSVAAATLRTGLGDWLIGCRDSSDSPGTPHDGSSRAH